jgi:hypothetical protein
LTKEDPNLRASINQDTGEDTTLLPDDLILRSRLDSLYPDIRYSGGWLKW